MTDSNSKPKPEAFPSTSWTLLDRARAGRPGDGAHALTELLNRYLPPLHAYLRAKWRLSSEDADDLLQGFVHEKILEQQLLEKADRQRGRFRSLLLKSLTNYVIDAHRQRRAHLPADRSDPNSPEAAERACDASTPDSVFEFAWARELVRRALARMRRECEALDRVTLWRIFCERVVDPVLHGTPTMSYSALVARHSLRSPAQASNLLVTAKRMYIRSLRAIVAEYVDEPGEIDGEIQDLREILARFDGSIVEG